MLPGASINQIEVPYFGRFIKVRGNRTFQDWTVTVIQDEDFTHRHALESWQNAINRFETNTADLATITGDPESYKSEALVRRFRKDGTLVREYRVVGLWPVDIAPVPLDWASNEIEEFQVTFAMDYWTLSSDVTTTGSFAE